MLLHSSKGKNKYLMAKFKFLNQPKPFVRKLHFSASW